LFFIDFNFFITFIEISQLAPDCYQIRKELEYFHNQRKFEFWGLLREENIISLNRNVHDFFNITFLESNVFLHQQLGLQTKVIVFDIVNHDSCQLISHTLQVALMPL